MRVTPYGDKHSDGEKAAWVSECVRLTQLKISPGHQTRADTVTYQGHDHGIGSA